MKTRRLIFLIVGTILVFACILAFVAMAKSTTIDVTHGNLYVFTDFEEEMDTVQGKLRIIRTVGWLVQTNPLKYGAYEYIQLFFSENEIPDFLLFEEDECNIIMDDGTFLEIRHSNVTAVKTSTLEACYASNG